MAVKFGNWQNCLDGRSNELSKKKKAELEENKNCHYFLKFVHVEKLIDFEWISNYFLECNKFQGGKSDTTAKEWREKGNVLFRHKKYIQSIECYNKCVLHASTDDKPSSDPQIALGYANRSAAFFYTANFQASLEDIDCAIENGYPSCLRHKLYRRQATCYEKLGYYQRSLSAVSNAKAALLANGVDGKDKDPGLKELEEIEEKIKLKESSARHEPSEEKLNSSSDVVPCGDYNTVITQASAAIELHYDDVRGRHLIAKEALEAGSVLITEKPFAAVVLPIYYNSHCHHCVKLVVNVIPCPQCSVVRYCSRECQRQSWQHYHSVECVYMDLLHSIGIAHLSLRVILVAGLNFLLNFRRTHQTSSGIPGLNNEGQYDQGYQAVYELMPHTDNMLVEDLLQYAMTARLLLRVLQEKIFKANEEMSPDELCIGELLLRHICQLVCNAHAITELTVTESQDSSSVETKSQVRVATAIYPTASLMNHSCDPTIIASFQNDRLIVRTMKDVKPGEEIFSCYGPHHCRMCYSERQQQLQEQYFFQCQCSACVNQGLDQLLYDAFRCIKCDGAAVEDPTLGIAKCVQCNAKHDIQSSKIELMAAQDLFVDALHNLEQNNVRGALAILHKCKAIREKQLYKHNRILAEVQDVQARCYSMTGDYKTACAYLSQSVKTSEKIYGQNSIEMANEWQKYAEVLCNAGKQKEALEAAEKSLKIFNLYYGKDHQSVKETEDLVHGLKTLKL